MTSFATLATGHAALRLLRRRNDQPAVLLSAALSIFRLLILLIVIGVVDFTHFYRTGPFLAGLMPVYFVGIWAEIAWLASPTTNASTKVSTG